MIRGIKGKANFFDEHRRREFVSRLGNLTQANERSKRTLSGHGEEGLEARVIKEICQKEGIDEKQLRLGGKTWEVSRVRAKIAWKLSREYGITFSEIPRELGVGKSAIAKAIRKIEKEKTLTQIISGGQTGVDRAALSVALELGILCGGWCPKDRKAEDGPINSRFPLKEIKSSRYEVRTEKNVKDSDGTLILTEGKPTGGTALTIKYANKHKKPHLVIDLDKPKGPVPVWRWMRKNMIRVLNVAGPRESKCPGINSRAAEFLKEVLYPEKRKRIQKSRGDQKKS